MNKKLIRSQCRVGSVFSFIYVVMVYWINSYIAVGFCPRHFIIEVTPGVEEGIITISRLASKRNLQKSFKYIRQKVSSKTICQFSYNFRLTPVCLVLSIIKRYHNILIMWSGKILISSSISSSDTRKCLSFRHLSYICHCK